MLTKEQIREVAEDSIFGLKITLNNIKNGRRPTIEGLEEVEIPYVLTKEEYDALMSSDDEYVRDMFPTLLSSRWENGMGIFTIYPKGYATLKV